MSNHHFHQSAGPFTILLFHFHSVPGRGFLRVGPLILHVRRTPAFSRVFFASRTAFFACRLTFLHVGQTYPVPTHLTARTPSAEITAVKRDCPSCQQVKKATMQVIDMAIRPSLLQPRKIRIWNPEKYVITQLPQSPIKAVVNAIHRKHSSEHSGLYLEARGTYNWFHKGKYNPDTKLRSGCSREL